MLISHAENELKIIFLTLQRQIDVYRLDPNTTYVFKIWANNNLGPGEETVLEATTLHDTEEIGEHFVKNCRKKSDLVIYLLEFVIK